MKKVLPNYVKEAREMTEDRQGVPTVLKKTYKLVKSWKRKGIPPGIANHPFWMNPRLTCQACGTILPDKIRLEKDARVRTRKKNAEARDIEGKNRKIEFGRRYRFEG